MRVIIQNKSSKQQKKKIMSDFEVESNQQSQVAGFVSKTYEILKNEEYSKIVFWGPTGRDFIIKDINKFQEVILPKYFRHKKINSFIRQLNMYGFHKSRKDSSKSIFSHPNFIKNKEDLLSSIKRKIKTNRNPPKTPQKIQNTKIDQSKIVETADKKQFESEKQIVQNEMEGTLRCFLDSRQCLNSRINLNFSLKKISMKNFDNLFREEASIELEIQEEKQKVENVKLMNPSFFFGEDLQQF